MGIVTQIDGSRSPGARVCYRCTLVCETADQMRCPSCGFALITESAGIERGAALPPRLDHRPLPGVTAAARANKSEITVAALEAGAATVRPRGGWLSRLRRVVFAAAVCGAAIGSGAALAATIA